MVAGPRSDEVVRRPTGPDRPGGNSASDFLTRASLGLTILPNDHSFSNSGQGASWEKQQEGTAVGACDVSRPVAAAGCGPKVQIQLETTTRGGFAMEDDRGMTSRKFRFRRLSLAFVPIVLAAGVSLVGPSSAGASTDAVAKSSSPTTFNFSFQEGTTSALLFFIAKDEGYFAKQGINVNLIPTAAQTGTLVAGIASGSLDGALTALSTVATTDQKGIATKLQGSFLLTDRDLIVPKGSTIPKAKGRSFKATLRALNGKVVGVPGIGGAPNLELNALLTSVGVSPSSVHFVDVEPGTPTVAAFESHSIDAAYVTTVAAAEAESAGLASQVFSAQTNGPQAYASSLLIGSMVSNSFLSAHKTFSAEFQKAMAQAIVFAKKPSNAKALVKISTNNGIATFAGLSQNLQEQKYSTSISTSAAKNVIAFMTKAQIVASTPSLSPAELIAPGSLTK
jgi:ABC-type nitrate/sulfonate/bicarbonate transport system substrate-binding protein